MIKLLPIIKDITITVATGATAFVAWRGLNTWRDQLYGKLEYDMIIAILKACALLRESIRTLRSRIGFTHEETAISEPNKAEQTTISRHEKRWQYCIKRIGELEASALEAEAHWGSEINELMKPVRKSFSEIEITLWELIDTKENPNGYEVGYKAKIRSAFFGKQDESDKLSQDFEKALQTLENEMRQRLSKLYPHRS